jgi:hypothetical protein
MPRAGLLSMCSTQKIPHSKMFSRYKMAESEANKTTEDVPEDTDAPGYKQEQIYHIDKK